MADEQLQKESIERQTAFKVKIKEVLDGEYVKLDGWQPNYIVIRNGARVSRVNIVCSVISKENDSLVVDDGSAAVRVRIFENAGLQENVMCQIL